MKFFNRHNVVYDAPPFFKQASDAIFTHTKTKGSWLYPHSASFRGPLRHPDEDRAESRTLRHTGESRYPASSRRSQYFLDSGLRRNDRKVPWRLPSSPSPHLWGTAFLCPSPTRGGRGEGGRYKAPAPGASVMGYLGRILFMALKGYEKV